MKKYAVLIILIFNVFFITCGEGYIAHKDAQILKKYLSPEELKKLTDNPDENIWIIDVRPKSSYDKGHIPTAKSFPSSEIMNRLNEIPKDKYLILYCETGGRAQAVIKMLMKEGYKKMMNWGGYTRWPYELVK